MPDPAETVPSIPSLPPDATAKDILQSMLPLVVQSSVASAANAARYAAAIESLETRIEQFEGEMKGRLDKIEEAVKDLSEERTSEIEGKKALTKAQIEERKVRTKEIYETVRSVLRPDVVLQTLIILGSMLALYFNLPQPQVVQAPAPAIESTSPSP